MSTTKTILSDDEFKPKRNPFQTFNNTKVSEDSQVPQTVNTFKNIKPNALSSFASVNYVIELQAASKIDEAEYFRTGKYLPAKWKTIISTKGSRGAVGIKPTYEPLPNFDLENTDDPAYAEAVQKQFTEEVYPWFNKNYHIDNLEFESVVGNDSISRSSLVCKVSFDVIEPYGINFISELYDFGTSGLGHSNYLDICYLLKISWVGYTDLGEVKKLDKEKFIPIRLTEIQVALTELGSRYQVQAVPWNLMPNTRVYGIMPESANLTGKTVGEFIKRLEVHLNTKTLAAINTSINERTNIQVAPIQYEIQVDSAITNSVFSDKKDILLKDRKFILPTVNDNITQQINSLMLVDSQQIQFKEGSSVFAAIEQIIINSEYITGQLREYQRKYKEIVDKYKDNLKAINEEVKNSLNEPLKWFKIKTRMERITDSSNSSTLNQAANLLNIDPKKLIITIQPYDIISVNHSGSGVAIVNSQKIKSKLYENTIKEYNYLFSTNTNTEVIKCDINFNLMYYGFNQRNMDGPRISTGAEPGTFNSGEGKGLIVGGQGGFVTTHKDPLNAGIIPYVSSAQPGRSVLSHSTPLRNSAAHLAETIYSRVDLVNINLEIMGDPDLIVQDVIIPDLNGQSVIAPNQQGLEEYLKFTKNQKFVRLYFKTYTDYNDDTGLLSNEQSAQKTPARSTVFDGFYIITTIMSSFKSGQFTQTLDLIKMAMANPVDVPENRQQSIPTGDPKTLRENLVDAPPIPTRTNSAQV